MSSSKQQSIDEVVGNLPAPQTPEWKRRLRTVTETISESVQHHHDTIQTDQAEQRRSSESQRVVEAGRPSLDELLALRRGQQPRVLSIQDRIRQLNAK
jgi:tRNA G37 N-methylase Trm5